MACSINKGIINTEQGSLTKSSQKVGALHCDIKLRTKIQKVIKRRTTVVIRQKFLSRKKDFEIQRTNSKLDFNLPVRKVTDIPEGHI